MGTQETLLTRKRRGPLPTGKGTLIGVRLQPEQLAKLDAWKATQPDLAAKPPEKGRPEAVRRLVAHALRIHGDQD